jgi:hypothetical protein
VYTDHRNLESFMTTKQLTRRQARWAKTMGCFDFKIIFCLGRQSSKPNTLSCRPDLATPQAEKLTFGQLLRPKNITPNTFAEIEAFEEDHWFEDKTIELEEAEHWFQVDVLGAGNPADMEEGDNIWTNAKLISHICDASSKDERLINLIAACQRGNPDPWYHTDAGILYHNVQMEVPGDNKIKRQILRSQHNSKPAGHPGRSKTLALYGGASVGPP